MKLKDQLDAYRVRYIKLDLDVRNLMSSLGRAECLSKEFYGHMHPVKVLELAVDELYYGIKQLEVPSDLVLISDKETFFRDVEVLQEQVRAIRESIPNYESICDDPQVVIGLFFLCDIKEEH